MLKGKWLSWGVCSLMMMNAYAVATGPYLGVMAGPARSTANTATVRVQTPPPPPFTVQASRANNQFAGRIYAGYKTNTYFDVEGGLTYFSTFNFQVPAPYNTSRSSSAGLGAVDLVAKAVLPVYIFSAFAKAGGAWTYLKASGCFYSSSNPTQNCATSAKVTKRIRPTYGLGGSYDINQNWVAEVSWMRINVGQMLSNVDFVGIGISYHFVDKYCGQFLCDD